MRTHKKPRFFTKLFHWFTLVELIVVISVLAVLASIAMSQVSNITAWARDSQRMTDMSSMKSSIELYKAKTGKLPIPTNGSWVTYSGALLWTQGTFGEPTWRQLNSITPKPVDPNNSIEYVYSVANNNREFELGGILEKATGLLLPIPQPLPQGRGVVGKEVVGAFLGKALPTPLSKALLEGWIFFDKTFAASQNVTFIEWTYNGISLKVETGSKTYVVAAPSLIGGYLGDSKMENTGLTIEGLGSLPKGFSGVVVSTAQTGTFTPVIAWSGDKLPDTSTGAEAMIIGLQSAYTGTVATSLSQISSLVSATGSQITALGEGLVENALGGDIGGTTSTSGGGGEAVTCSATCSTWFICVPWNATFNTTDFCVMKYEAKALWGAAWDYNGHTYNAADTIVSNAADYPINNVTQSQAITACQSIGAHLITNNEWMTIARNIEQVTSNWSSGIVWNGYIYSWHNDSAPANLLVASTDDNNGYLGTGDSATSPWDSVYMNFGSNVEQAYKWQRRTLTLSSWNVIWDLAGNVWEHVNKANTIDGAGYTTNQTSFTCGNPTSYAEWTTCNTSDRTAQSASNASYNSAQGIGQIVISQGVPSNIFFRGGSRSNGAYAGIFALYLGWTTGYSNSIVGFRCAK